MLLDFLLVTDFNVGHCKSYFLAFLQKQNVDFCMVGINFNSQIANSLNFPEHPKSENIMGHPVFYTIMIVDLQIFYKQ